MNGMDYHFWVNKIKNDKLFLTINTSIGHPKFLPNKQNDATIIITKSGDTIIREQFENNNFTKIVRGDIIIYIN
jgi:ribosomal protein S10